MKTAWLSIVLVTLSLTPAAAGAQDGVFDMGQLTATLSQDHNTQRERARARQQGVSRQELARRTARRHCASMSSFRARYGARDPRIIRLTSLCRRAGHRVG